MAIQDDFTIDFDNRLIDHTSGTTVYSVNAFYTWVVDEFDEYDPMDDLSPLEAPSAIQFRLINEWYITRRALKFLKGDNGGSKDGGSLQTVGWARVVDTAAGIVKVARTGSNIVAGDEGLAITHADGDSGVLLEVDGSNLFIRPDSSAAANNWDSVAGNITCNAHVDVQAAAAVSGESLWANLYSIGSDDVIASITLYLEQNGAAIDVSDLSSGYTTGHIDLLMLVQDMGTLIDSGDVTVLAREWGYTYDFYTADLSAGGRLPAPIAVQADSNNQTAVGTVEAYGVAVAFGSYTADVDQAGGDENYEIQIDLANTHTILQAYEYTKAITRRGQTGLLDGVQGQLYKSADPTYAVVKANPFMSYAGGKGFGARGLYFLLANRPASEANAYELIDSDNNGGIKEPTSITIQINNTGDLGNGFPKVLVAVKDPASMLPDFDQYQTAAAGNNAGSSTITLSAPPDSDVPSSGAIRVNKKRYVYSSVSGAVFTLDVAEHPTGTDEANNDVPAYVPFLDETAAGATTSVGVSYASDKAIVTTVRKKGEKEFTVAGQVTANGYAAQAIRPVDEVVS